MMGKEKKRHSPDFELDLHGANKQCLQQIQHI